MAVANIDARWRKTAPTLLVMALVAQLATGCSPRESGAGTDKRACAEIIQRAVASSHPRDEAQEIVRADPQARKVCAGLEMNGVPIVP